MKIKDRWKPIRRGAIYCSPGCGASCTLQQFNAAHKAARDCLKRMKNPDVWKIEVHENMGWFWGLRHKAGHLSVRGGQLPYKDNPKRGFHAMLSRDKDSPGCDSLWHDSRIFKDPNKAVEHRLKLARQHLAQVLYLLDLIQ